VELTLWNHSINTVCEIRSSREVRVFVRISVGSPHCPYGLPTVGS